MGWQNAVGGKKPTFFYDNRSVRVTGCGGAMDPDLKAVQYNILIIHLTEAVLSAKPDESVYNFHRRDNTPIIFIGEQKGLEHLLVIIALTDQSNVGRMCQFKQGKQLGRRRYSMLIVTMQGLRKVYPTLDPNFHHIHCVLANSIDVTILFVNAMVHLRRQLAAHNLDASGGHARSQLLIRPRVHLRRRHPQVGGVDHLRATGRV